MPLPFYNGHGDSLQDRDWTSGHAGLCFERFFNGYNAQWKIEDENDGKDNPKHTWLRENFSGKQAGSKQALEAFCLRQWRLADSLGGCYEVFKSEWHFVTGMGNPHPVENGFSWHPVLGAPYLSGAAVKGMLRSYLEAWEEWKDKDAGKEKLLQWFGSTDKNPTAEGRRSQAGGLIFFDAVPVEPVRLSIDIMTPHMGEWYAKGGEITKEKSYPSALPADWHDPNPIPFLAAIDLKLLFSIAPRPHAPDKMDLNEVMRALKDALKWQGAGAKTAAGYGQFALYLD
ncbi:MAG: type III-B CRISPR module RAMP protein Cmr6 [Gammaproteobacteria bacterium]|nr:type III-B CRISPR module RAMP protein Cmr6 [Gammaproteobacteria bacterium]